MNKRATDYPQEITELSKSVLLEIMTLLKGYSKNMVLVGGWVPYFLLKRFQKDQEFKHIGSADIDLVINPELIKSGVYESIVKIIEQNGYSQRKDKLGNPIEFSFKRTINGQDINIDFLSTDYPEKNKKRHRIVQPDLKTRTLKGARIVLKHNYDEEIEGNLPNGAYVKAKIKVADAVGCLITKALALGGRSEAKDNYDIYTIISYYKDGEKSCAEEIKPFLDDEDIKEPLDEIKKNFEKETSLGPVLIGNFMHPNDEYARDRIIIDSFMRINRFLELLER
ncbi:hypothetical protein HZC30_02720 [Candidatus Woesearchaeota archaeon]|nr:hypothetical protein [Candidatus Woesearchaeota archaeon]